MFFQFLTRLYVRSNFLNKIFELLFVEDSFEIKFVGYSSNFSPKVSELIWKNSMWKNRLLLSAPMANEKLNEFVVREFNKIDKKLT